MDFCFINSRPHNFLLQLGVRDGKIFIKPTNRLLMLRVIYSNLLFIVMDAIISFKYNAMLDKIVLTLLNER